MAVAFPIIQSLCSLSVFCNTSFQLNLLFFVCVSVLVCKKISSQQKSQVFSWMKTWGRLSIGHAVFCIEMLPRLGSRALRKNVSCQGIMTCADLFKALTRQQYRTKSQLILCVWHNLVCIVMRVLSRPNPPPPPPKKKRILNEGGSHIEMLKSTTNQDV